MIRRSSRGPQRVHVLTWVVLALLVAFLGLRSHRGAAAHPPEPAGAPPAEQGEPRANPAATHAKLPPKPSNDRNG